MLRILLLTMLILATFIGGCADEKVYDWQRPHDTYQVGSFSKYQNAEALKQKLQKNGFDGRVETDIKNGQFYLNVLVDVYDKTPDTLAKIESITGIKPYLRSSQGSAKAPATPASPIPGKDI